MCKILKYDDQFVYISREGKIKKIARELFDFDIQLGDKIELLQDGDITLVLPYQDEVSVDFDDAKSVKSGLLQGILNLFLETLAIHNNDLGNLKKIFSQLLVTIFMAWSLLGVIAIELLLFIESVIAFIWRLLVKGLRALHIWDNSKKFISTQKEQAAQRRQEQREEQVHLARIQAAEKAKAELEYSLQAAQSESLSSSESQSVSENLSESESTGSETTAES